MDCAGEGSTKCRWCDRTCYDELFPWHFTLLLWSCHAVTPRVTCSWHHQPPHDGDVSINYWCSSGWAQLALVWYLTILTSIYLHDWNNIWEGQNTVSRHGIGTLGCKVNHQQPAFRIFANQKPNCLSIVFAEKHPGTFSNCCATSCYINVKIVKYLWWHGYNGHRMMDVSQGSSALLCCAVTT